MSTLTLRPRGDKASGKKMRFSVIIIIIIMVIFRCYFSGELIALSYKKYIKKKTKKTINNGVNIELGKTNRLKALCMMQIKK